MKISSKNIENWRSWKMSFFLVVHFFFFSIFFFNFFFSIFFPMKTTFYEVSFFDNYPCFQPKTTFLYYFAHNCISWINKIVWKKISYLHVALNDVFWQMVKTKVQKVVYIVRTWTHNLATFHENVHTVNSVKCVRCKFFIRSTDFDKSFKNEGEHEVNISIDFREMLVRTVAIR